MFQEKQEKVGKTRKRLLAITITAAVIIIGVFSNSIIETNETGHIQVKQALGSGEMSVRLQAGTYGQWGGSITDYLYSGSIFLSADNLDGGDEEKSMSIDVLFPDGECSVDFVGQYEVRASEEVWLNIKKRYPTNSLLEAMIRNQIVEVIRNTGSLMNAEEAYSSKRSEFIQLCEQQVKRGLYMPTYETIYDTIQGGQVQETRVYSVKKDGAGIPVIAKAPLLAEYDIIFSQFNIKNMHNFDDQTINLIAQRKQAKAASQSAITAKANGEATIAKKKAEQETLKIEAVTKAEKEKAVAVLNAEKAYEVEALAAKKAKQTAIKIREEGNANAAANRALVAAGLTPEQKMEMEITIADKVSANIAKASTPQVVFMGGSGGGGGASEVMKIFGAERSLALIKSMKTK